MLSAHGAPQRHGAAAREVTHQPGAGVGDEVPLTSPVPLTSLALLMGMLLSVPTWAGPGGQLPPGLIKQRRVQPCCWLLLVPERG